MNSICAGLGSWNVTTTSKGSLESVKIKELPNVQDMRRFWKLQC